MKMMLKDDNDGCDDDDDGDNNDDDEGDADDNANEAISDLKFFPRQLICRKRTIETADEEEQTPKQADSEKLMYPPVHPIQTMSASMIQPGGGQVYTISGIPLKPRKWKGSQKSLLDR